ncbi:hypothetical protein GX441_07100 [bacterium]|nr:hypothetical protein [bacterium]
MEDKQRKRGLNNSKECGDYSPRPSGRGFFLLSRWSFKNGKPLLKFYAHTPNDQWRFRRSWIFKKFLSRALRGENRTNNSSSKTRHGSDAVCRYIRSIANPDICFDSFFYLLVSGYAGGNSEASMAAYVRADALDSSLDALRRGFYFAEINGITKEVR